MKVSPDPNQATAEGATRCSGMRPAPRVGMWLSSKIGSGMEQRSSASRALSASLGSNLKMRDDAPRDLAHGLIFLGPPAPNVVASGLGRSGAMAGRMRSLPTNSLASPKSRVEGADGGSSLPDHAMGLAPRRTSAPSRTMSRRMRVEA